MANMSEELGSSALNFTPGSLQIFIPCWIDYKQALTQAQNLRNQYKEFQGSFFKIRQIRIVLSVNGADIEDRDELILSEIFDDVIRYQSGIGGDVNITSGFTYALMKPAEYFWILSTNDLLNEDCLANIDRVMMENFDVAAVNKEPLYGMTKVASTFTSASKSIQFGLVSAVIYSYESMHKYFPIAPKYNWTGWGQLAVIESAMIEKSGIEVCLLNSKDLFSETTQSRQKSRAKIQHDYRHSFFGLPLLISCLYYSDPVIKKKLVSSWLRKNWYQLHFYASHKTNLNRPQGDIDPAWVESLAKLVIAKTGTLSKILLMVGFSIDFESVRSNKLLQKIRYTLDN
jgi:hypothetical protein